FFASRRRHTRSKRDWSSDVCSSDLIRKTYGTLAQIEGVKILVSNYFGELRDNMELFTSLPVTGLHIDAVRGRQELTPIAARLDRSEERRVGKDTRCAVACRACDTAE